MLADGGEALGKGGMRGDKGEDTYDCSWLLHFCRGAGDRVAARGLGGRVAGAGGGCQREEVGGGSDLA